MADGGGCPSPVRSPEPMQPGRSSGWHISAGAMAALRSDDSDTGTQTRVCMKCGLLCGLVASEAEALGMLSLGAMGNGLCDGLCVGRSRARLLKMQMALLAVSC
jgi:hypothetical protein